MEQPVSLEAQFGISVSVRGGPSSGNNKPPVEGMKLRIALVNYLNAAPLGWAFLHGPLRDSFEVVSSSPALCADLLSSGAVDIGLIPSIEYQQIPGIRVLPGISIASARQARSVLLVCPKGVATIRSVALDTSSRCSATLLRILLAKRGLQPEYLPHDPDLSAMLRHCDAALIIGDAALKLPDEKYQVLDLAEEWVRWQGTPFVFAFWAVRAGVEVGPDTVRLFHEAKRWGLASRDAIVKMYSRSLGLPVPLLSEYLGVNIEYGLAEAHQDSLREFFRLAHGASLIPHVVPLRFTPSYPVLGKPV